MLCECCGAEINITAILNACGFFKAFKALGIVVFISLYCESEIACRNVAI